MDASYWLECWREGRTGFHRAEVMPLLEKHWPALRLPRGTRVLVPLAGKTLDMAWLAAQGLRVLGVELSPLAVQAFFDEHGLEPRRHVSACGEHYVAGDIEMIQGNVFDLDDATLAGCMGIYDRAALIALPPAMRRQYVRSVYARLPAACRGLLITLDYPAGDMEGPPFTVPRAEVERLFASGWRIATLEHRDILAEQPGLAARGLSALATDVYRLDRRA
ncbi:thiopurine S-methyltransferase [Frateuria terrea]|uniref:Thiopurine S-methyltransferase n=1 Tax=Frateuria terrea TaxID=529704 RepID=A0A1H6ZLZ8_9GAMM|nr:thiopurine S-methyltransferase [Frateuria terrea]SEJ50712.1 thiopurine S-methyltransferase [Frateuria terrea]SFP78998.1 thiopurine S-methyltransferase [Frateuria terrea]